MAEKNGRGGEIRTHDLLYPKQARYQATLRPDPEQETVAGAAAVCNRIFADFLYWVSDGGGPPRRSAPVLGRSNVGTRASPQWNWTHRNNRCSLRPRTGALR